MTPLPMPITKLCCAWLETIGECGIGLVYICSAQFANLCNFEIALRKLEIVKLLTNFETGVRFRNCIALLHIFEIA